MVADTPPSRAGSLLQVDWVHLRNIGWLAGRLRWQASSHNWIGCIRKMLVGCQAAFAGRPAPTVEWGYLQEIGRLSGRLRGQASLLQWNGGTCKRLVGCQAAIASRLTPTVEWEYLQNIGRLSGRLRGQASLLQWNGCTCKRLVGCQAAFAGKPRSYSGMGVPARDWSAVRPTSRASLAPTVEWVYLQEIGWLSGRLRWQASSHSGMWVPARDWSAGRPPSRASLAPTVECGYLQEIGRLSGRLRGQASLLQWNGCTCKRLVGWQAAFAGKPRSYSGMGVPAK